MGTKLLGAAASNANDAIRKSELDAAIAGVSGGGGGGAPWVEVEIDFGSTPSFGAQFTITAASSTGSSKIAAVQSGAAGTGRVAGDTEWDSLILSTVPGSGSFTLTALPHPGPVVGTRKILYQIS